MPIKLLRYEFRGLLRIIPVLYLAIMALAVAAGFNSDRNSTGWNSADWNNPNSYLPTNPFLILWGISFLVLFIVNAVLVILRFRDNLLRDEGYLMFTLPVPEWELVMSKAVAAFCTFLVTGIACFLSTLIYAFIAHYRQFPDGVSRMFHDLLENQDPVSPSLIIRIVTVMVVVFQQLYLVYAVMTASQLVPRFRILAGFGVYIGIIVFVQQPLGRAINTLPLSGTPQLLVSACFAAVLAALYFCCVNLLLKHRLNLE